MSLRPDRNLQPGGQVGPQTRRRRAHSHRFLSPSTASNTTIASQRTNLSRMPAGASVPKETPINATVDEVMKVVCFHESFALSDFGEAVEDLPKFEDITNYDVPPAREKELWRLEVERLVEVVKNPEWRPVYPRAETSSLGGDTRDSYDTLTALSNRILTCFNIIALDNELIFREYYPMLCQEDRLTSAHHQLKRLVEEPNRQKEMRKGDAVDYYNLVDYITACMAKIYCGTAYGSSWHNGGLATLATWSTKLKVLQENVVEFAERAIEGVRIQQIVIVQTNEASRGNSQETVYDKLLEEDEDFNSSQDIVKHGYWTHRSKFRIHLHRIFVDVLASLRGRYEITPIAPIPITSYEICSEVYESGFEGFPTLVHQDRMGEVLGSSDSKCLSISHAAFELVNQAILVVKSQHRPPSSRDQHGAGALGPRDVLVNEPTARLSPTTLQPPPSTNVPPPRQRLQESSIIGTRVSWRYTNAKETLRLENMEEIIAVMVPLVMTSPIVFGLLNVLADLIIFTTGMAKNPSQNVVRFEDKKFKASFCLSTEEYDNQCSGGTDPFVSSLSRGLITRDQLLFGKQTAEIRGTTDFQRQDSNSNRKAQQTIDARLKEIADADTVMNTWEISENGVMVKCGLWVCAVAVSCIILVGGGIAIGLTVGNRVRAVDPFNITTYCWVLAAFVLLVAKSMRVENWPWRDFLKGRVFCRSVSELHSVSRVEVQLIIAKLLHDERTSRLQTRGPYNTVFRNKSADGFSIDEPLTMWTMLLSGLIMVKVATPSGEGLVCLDLRQGTRYAVVPHVNPGHNSDPYIYCEPDLFHQHSDSSASQLRLRLAESKFEWHQVLGFFKNRQCTFV